MNNDCAEIRELFSPYADGELDDAGQAAVTAHLAACLACREEWEARQRMQELLECWQAPEAPPSATARLAEALAAREKRPAVRWLPRLAWGTAGLCAILALALAQHPAERAGQYTFSSLPESQPRVMDAKKPSPPSGPGDKYKKDVDELADLTRFAYTYHICNEYTEERSLDETTVGMRKSKRMAETSVYPPVNVFYSRNGWDQIRRVSNTDADTYSDLAETGRR